MRLKHQIFIISLSLLIVPWAGYVFVGELEKTLRENHLRLLEHTANIAARQILASPLVMDIPTISDASEVIYAHRFSGKPVMDGYSDDWQSLNTALQTSRYEKNLAYMAAHHGKEILLFIKVHDANIHYRHPGAPITPESDGILLTIKPGGSEHTSQIRLHPIAPGPVQPVVIGHKAFKSLAFPNTDNFEAIWQDTGQGYTLEIRMPEAWLISGLQISTMSNHQDRLQPMAQVIVSNDQLSHELEIFTANNIRIQLIDRSGWILAEAGSTSPESIPETDIPKNWLTEILGTLLRWILLDKPEKQVDRNTTGKDNAVITQRAIQENQSMTGWFSNSYALDALSVVVIPVQSPGNSGSSFKGALRIEQTTHVMATLSNQAVIGLLGASVLVFVTIASLLVGYVSWISYRIVSLKKQVRASMTADGQLTGSFSGSPKKDEIGELSRQFEQLFRSVEGYTDYLETFSQKLVHEIKTPVAVVSSSLDILNHALPENQDDTYIKRAQDGIIRISHIINALREATRLERSIENTERLIFSLSDLVSEIFLAYQSIDTEHELTLESPEKDIQLYGSPELIAQLLDKLFDNARGHTPKGGNIHFRLTVTKKYITLSVTNTGSQLPTESQDIFDSFISHRDENTEGHMGLGLVIVKLIARFHGGQVSAENLKDKAGVIFKVELPTA